MTKKKLILLAVLCGLLALPAPVAARDGGPPMRIVRDDEIEHDLKVLCAPVFRQAGVSPSAVRFVLVEDDQLNAFVAGGQNIFVNTGLILKTENPLELVGVIAHETGHIALGHLFRSQEMMDDYTMQAWLASAAGIAAAVLGRSGSAGMTAAVAGRSMAMRTALGHSRTQEASADEAGVRYMKGARLPLTGFLSFMEKISSQELLPESAQSQYVQNHPLTQDRIDFLKNAVAEQAASGAQTAVPPAWAGLHGRVKAKLLGYLYPDRALQDRGESADALYARAIAWYRKGEAQKSLALQDRLIALEPDNPYFHELKGQTLFEAARIDEAAESYARAVALLPEAGLIRAAYGRALLESKTGGRARTEEAARQLQRALESEPRSSDAWHALAMAQGRLGLDGQSRLALSEEYALQGRGDMARREAQLAVKALPPGSPARLRAEDILATNKKDKKKKDGENDHE